MMLPFPLLPFSLFAPHFQLCPFLFLCNSRSFHSFCKPSFRVPPLNVTPLHSFFSLSKWDPLVLRHSLLPISSLKSLRHHLRQSTAASQLAESLLAGTTRSKLDHPQPFLFYRPFSQLTPSPPFTTQRHFDHRRASQASLIPSPPWKPLASTPAATSAPALAKDHWTAGTNKASQRLQALR